MAENTKDAHLAKLETAVAVMQRDIEYLKVAYDDQKKLSEAILSKIDSLSFVTIVSYDKDLIALNKRIDELNESVEGIQKSFDENKPGIRLSNLLENKLTTLVVSGLVAAAIWFIVNKGGQL